MFLCGPHTSFIKSIFSESALKNVICDGIKNYAREMVYVIWANPN